MFRFLLVETGVSWIFWLGWSQTMFLQISTSWVVKGMNHSAQSFKRCLFFFFFFGVTRQARYHLNHSVSPVFVLGVFKIESCELFAWGWLPTMMLLISASWVARITGVRCWRPAKRCLFILNWILIDYFTFYWWGFFFFFLNTFWILTLC
jgi:hypothetical protein